MLLNNSEFKELKQKHAKEILELLITSSTPFSVVAFRDAITFNPPLPQHITQNFGEIILFKISNYTLSTANIVDNKLEFEAGFGEENIGSIVSIPIFSILQLIYNEDMPIFTNPAATKEEEKPKNPFALNPKNSKLIE